MRRISFRNWTSYFCKCFLYKGRCSAAKQVVEEATRRDRWTRHTNAPLAPCEKKWSYQKTMICAQKTRSKLAEVDEVVQMRLAPLFAASAHRVDFWSQLFGGRAESRGPGVVQANTHVAHLWEGRRAKCWEMLYPFAFQNPFCATLMSNNPRHSFV